MFVAPFRTSLSKGKVIAVYHPLGDSSKRIVTIQYPHALVVLDFDRSLEKEGWEYPAVTVFSEMSPEQVSNYIESFGGFEEVFSSVVVDSWSDKEWKQNNCFYRRRSYITTFVDISSVSSKRVEK